MAIYQGNLRMLGEEGRGIGVTIDLTEDRLALQSGATEIGNWSRSEMRVNALPDGFHMRVEGEEVILDISRDAEFAVELGIMNAPPLLRRRMSALMREV